MASYPALPFFIGIVASSVLYTWIFNNTKGSLILVTLFHAAENTTGGFLEVSISDLPTFITYRAGVVLIAAIIVVTLFGKENLSRSTKRLMEPL